MSITRKLRYLVLVFDTMVIPHLEIRIPHSQRTFTSPISAHQNGTTTIRIMQSLV